MERLGNIPGRMKPSWLMQPMPIIALPREEGLADGRWAVENKIDGWRIQIIVEEGEVGIFTKHIDKGNCDITWWPGLQRVVGSLRILGDTHIDGELTTNTNNRSHIPSLKSKDSKYKDLQATIWPFDLIDHGTEYYVTRRSLLEDMIHGAGIPSSLVRFLPVSIVYNYSDINHYLEEAWRDGYEGLVLKNLYSYYNTGEIGLLTTPDWIRVKQQIMVPDGRRTVHGTACVSDSTS